MPVHHFKDSKTGRSVLTALARCFPQRYPYLLQSNATSQRHGNTSRFDILFGFPQGHLSRHADGRLTWQTRDIAGNDFLESFDDLWKQQIVQNDADGSLPFSGGWFVYLGYELAQEIEPSLKLPNYHGSLPIAHATRIPVAVIYDHYENHMFIFAEPGYEYTFELISEDINCIAQQTDSAADTFEVTEESPDHYLDAVTRVHEYIRAGDVFQVNLSREWRSRIHKNIDTVNLYQRLCQSNPAPFAGLAQFEHGAIISSSPERLIRVHEGKIETRPIAGTRPRQINPQNDQLSGSELLAHPKERAEHIMLIDLERNDLGRICRPGSIHVDELMVLESYAHVHHIVSNVSGQLRDNITPGQIIRATFPGGTITGCPKVRCMEIIAELEQTPRGAYTGSMGYITHRGNMDLNILIRTIVQDGNALHIRAGAGLVIDSNAQRELEETRAKAKGMLLALKQATA